MSNRLPLKLHIPEPHARPGDTPDFNHLVISEPGAVRRPDVMSQESEMRDMPYGLIRVLGEDGRAVGPWNPRLDSRILHRGLRAMLLTRMFDEHMFRAHRQ